MKVGIYEERCSIQEVYFITTVQTQKKIRISIQKTKSNLAWIENQKQTKGTEHQACYFINLNLKNKINKNQHG